MGSPKHKVAIVIPYFGKWPVWFEFFLQSCRYNTSVNWFFYTDCKIPDIKKGHIQFFQFTLDDFNKLASRKTGVEIDIRHPYKLCDLKPAYGDIFAEYLTDFDFWGYGDIDLIYGKFDQFFSDEILERYDIFSNHDEFISGHLCIIRNSSDAISLYRKGGAYKNAFKDPFYTGFDEQLLKRKFNPESTGLSTKDVISFRTAYEQSGHAFYNIPDDSCPYKINIEKKKKYGNKRFYIHCTALC